MGKVMERGRSRYSLVAIVLHWLIALGLLVTIPLAWWMTGHLSNPSQQARVFAAYQLHKSIGLTVLVLTVLRLIWRLLHPVPPFPPAMPRWERVSARLVHFLLYALMLMLPLTGWAYVSAGWNTHLNVPFAVPTLWFGLFEWPHIPWVVQAPDADRAGAAAAAMGAHELLAWIAVALVAVHAAAALKHHFLDRDDVLASMFPLVRPRGPRHLAREDEAQ